MFMHGADIMNKSHWESPPALRDKCRTAPDGRRPLGQADGLEPLARLSAAMKPHPPSQA